MISKNYPAEWLLLRESDSFEHTDGLRYPNNYDPEWLNLPEGEYQVISGAKHPIDLEVINEIKNIAEGQEFLRLISFTKELAYNKIVVDLNLPEWKQRNYSAESQVILEKKIDGTATDEDLDRLKFLKNIYIEKVNKVRDASNIVETEIQEGTVTTEEQVVDHIAWPIFLS